jgi:hypothetical protein
MRPTFLHQKACQPDLMSQVLRRRLAFAALILGVPVSIALLNRGLQGNVPLGQLAVVLFLACVAGFALVARRRS